MLLQPLLGLFHEDQFVLSHLKRKNIKKLTKEERFASVVCTNSYLYELLSKYKNKTTSYNYVFIFKKKASLSNNINNTNRRENRRDFDLNSLSLTTEHTSFKSVKTKTFLVKNKKIFQLKNTSLNYEHLRLCLIAPFLYQLAVGTSFTRYNKIHKARTRLFITPDS